MKNLFIIYIIFISINSLGQLDSSLAKFGKLDFAVPEHPAFSILDNNPDNILKPGNSQEAFSFIYSNFLNGKTPIIPKDFSMEFSPAQLIGINKITFEDYMSNANRILYDSKLSIGAKTSDDGMALHNFALGLRLLWVDKSSLCANKEYVDKVCKSLRLQAKDENSFIEKLIKDKQLYKDKTFTVEDIASDDELKKFVHKLYINSNASQFFSVKSLREEYKNRNWNKMKFETAVAIKFSSHDSLVTNNHYSKFEIYNTLALPVGKSGQWLLGLNLSDMRKDSIHKTITDTNSLKYDTTRYNSSIVTLASRIYIGSNNFKAFLEASSKLSSDKTMQLGLMFGSEINISDGIWAMINLGNNWTKSNDVNNQKESWNGNWIWGFDLRFKLPEKKRI